jgi:hypothetical protein
MQVEFSHRPKMGISIGVAVENDVGYISAAFTNTDAGDAFNRRIARQIIRQRIQSLVNGNPRVKFATSFSVSKNMDSKEVMKVIREWFKPMPDESDNRFIDNPLSQNPTVIPNDRVWELISEISNIKLIGV